MSSNLPIQLPTSYASHPAWGIGSAGRQWPSDPAPESAHRVVFTDGSSAGVEPVHIGATQSAYALDFMPHGYSGYSQASSELGDESQRAALMSILLNGFALEHEATSHRAAVGLSLLPGDPDVEFVATQAALWHVTQGVHLDPRFNTTATVARYRQLLRGAMGDTNPAAEVSKFRAPRLVRVAPGGGFGGTLRWQGHQPARVRALGAASALVLDEQGNRSEVLMPEKEYRLFLGPLTGQGELAVQLSFETIAPALTAWAPAGHVAGGTAVALRNEARRAQLTHRIILVPAVKGAARFGEVRVSG